MTRSHPDRIWAVRRVLKHCKFQDFYDVLSLCTAVWTCVVVMQKKRVSSRLILQMRCLIDSKFTQYLSEFTVDRLVGNSM